MLLFQPILFLFLFFFPLFFYLFDRFQDFLLRQYFIPHVGVSEAIAKHDSDLEVRKRKAQSGADTYEEEGEDKPKKKKKREKSIYFDEDLLEGGYDAQWVQPVNQTGDGKTYLNDKFGY